ncbi:hypothetical protein PR202_gb19386 [Eleusine coracana subsp. coracana]|uniref:RING-type domain-containing protein n=1 Tax=Eleusine coracana subsp. coracana TaxID=191504 RepID=A0AAV5F862_ELECO|nr:hypothetical protein PR202_gb19386 [Eleusine coracana subsp. coracana]
MSFVFRGSRPDIEAGGFPGFVPERRTMRIHAGGRSVNNNSFAFLVTVLILFMVLNSHQMSPNFLKNEGGFNADGTGKTLDDELTCSVCLEQVDVGDLLRSLPCLHQFHVNCIDPWLRQQGTCPVCKHQVSDGWQGGGSGEEDASYMVSSSMEKNYPIDSPLKKRKSQYELVDPRLLSLKYKFQKRLSRLEDESATTESIGCDGFFINKTAARTWSAYLKNWTLAQLSGSSSLSNIFSYDASSSRSTGTKETESWIMHSDECYHPDMVLQQCHNDFDRMYDVLEQYGDLMDGELAGGDVHGSAAHIMDEKLYSNGVDDFQILPTGPTSSHGEKKLTIDQEFEQYFSRLML